MVAAESTRLTDYVTARIIAGNLMVGECRMLHNLENILGKGNDRYKTRLTTQRSSGIDTTGGASLHPC